MSLLAAHLDTPLSEPTKKFQWLHCLKWFGAQQKHPSLGKTRAHPLSEEDPLELSIPKCLQPLWASQKSFQPSWASQNSCSPFWASQNAFSSPESFWKISDQRLQEFQCKVEIMCERNVALGKSCSPQFWDLQPAWSPAELGQAEPWAVPAAPGAVKTQMPAALGALVPLPGWPLHG